MKAVKTARQPVINSWYSDYFRTVLNLTPLCLCTSNRNKRKQRIHKATQDQSPHYNGLSFYSHYTVLSEIIGRDICWGAYSLTMQALRKLKPRGASSWIEFIPQSSRKEHHTRISSDISALVETTTSAVTTSKHYLNWRSNFLFVSNKDTFCSSCKTLI